MDFGEILSKAWKITWKHKILWFFGILAGCSGNVSAIRNLRDDDSFADLIPQIELFFQQVETFFDNLESSTLVLFIVGFFVLILIAAIISFIGLVGLIYGASRADEMDESSANLTFKEIWQGSKPYFWRIIKASLLAGLAIFVSILLLSIPVLLLSATSAVLCVVPLLCLIVPVTWVLGTVAQQSIAAIINEDLGASDSIKRAWQIVIKERIGSYLILSLILGVGGAIIGFVIGLPVFLIMIPFIFGPPTSNGLITIIVFIAVYILIIATPLSGILNAYIFTAWTLAFRRCASASPKEPEEIEAESELLNEETLELVE